MSISPAKRKMVAERSRFLCEYCISRQNFSPTSFSIKHIFPKVRKGSDEIENLALACQGCNSYKSDKITAVDLVSGRTVLLYNPRKDVWEENFARDEDFTKIVGLTAKGRATVELLKLNRQEVVNLRKMLRFFGEHPPVK